MLNGDLSLCPTCDFNELRVSEIARSTTLRDDPVDKPSAAWREPISWGLNISTPGKRDCFGLLVKILGAPPIIRSYGFITDIVSGAADA